MLRSPDDGSLELSLSNQSNRFIRDYYSLDVRGNRTYWLRKADRPYDARVRPWYQAALVAQGPAWTDVYIAFTTGLPNITASLPVYDPFGKQLLGVCATDVVLPEEFRSFLRNLNIGKTGQAFVIDRDGKLISNSTDEPLMVGTGDQARSLLATESQDPLVKETAHYLIKQFGNFEQIDHSQQLNFQLGGKRQFLEVLPFQDEFGLDWLIVAVVPEADFMAQINANTRNTILLCTIALGIAICNGILAARWITQPILQIAQASQSISEGDLSQDISSGSIVEINTLALAFNQMTDQLKTSFAELEAKNVDLEQAKDQLSAVLNAVPGTIAWISADGQYLGVNHHLCEIFRRSPREILGQPIGFLGNSSDYAQFMESFLASDRQFDSTESVILIDDIPHYYLIAVQKYQQGSATVSVGIDITDRHEIQQALRLAEENYRSIYENALEGIFQSDPNGYFISVNPAMARIYGYDSPTEMIESITDIKQQIYVNADDQALFKQSLEQQGKVQGLEYQVFRKDGSIIWVQEDARVVHDDQGDTLYFEGIIQDITDRKRREADLKREVEKLRIEIDENKLAKQVAEITDSDYFQEILAQAGQLRYIDED